MSGAIEALYIFDEHNNLILNHIYTSRPPPPSTLLPLYLQHPSPRPSVLYLSSLHPPILLHSIIQDNLLFLSPSSSEPLQTLEFLHRLADALEEFLGSPLLASKITSSYDVVAQILAEMADAGVMAQSEPNALRDVVESGPGVLKNLLGSIGALQTGGGGGGAGGASASGPGMLLRPHIQQAHSAQGSAIPWRRSNVRHTSNELYVDIVESLSVTVAPSSRPLAAFVHGSIAFTSKVSGVPDLLLTLSPGGMGAGMGTAGAKLRRVMERAVFHPCVRLSRWEKEGVLSFVPPDGRFALCGYEVDLLGPEFPLTAAGKSKDLNLPAMIEVDTGLGGNGADFEVRLSQPTSSITSNSASGSGSGGGGGTRSAATASLQSNLSTRPARPNLSSVLSGTTSGGGDSKAPALEELTVNIPIPPGVRNVSDLRASRGEAQWLPTDGKVEWKVPAKEFGFGVGGTAVLKGTVLGPVVAGGDGEDGGDGNGSVNGMMSTTYDYDEEASRTPEEHETHQSAANGPATKAPERNKEWQPTSATLSFGVKGWLASGLKVESLLLDTKKSRGLGPEVKPYKGVKYLTVSKGGVEVRC